jgi:3-oxoacyl-[acyl-carrier-protein] synthase II
MGVITCLGTGRETNWKALVEGRSGIGPITAFDATGFATRIAGEVLGNFDPEGHVPKKELRRLDRHQIFCIIAASEAMQQSGLNSDPGDPYRCGSVVGSGMGGLQAIIDGQTRFLQMGARSRMPLVITQAAINLAPGLLSIKYGFKGPNFGLANACSSGASAIGEAYRIVRDGTADVMITGGSEAVISGLAVTAFSSLRALSTCNDKPEKASRPFDLHRDGFVLSEGAGVLVLESEEHARDRGAEMLAEIVGYGTTDDGFHVVMPDPQGEGAYRSMKNALEDAAVHPEQIDYINAHGTATEMNDKMETIAIKKLIGDAAKDVAISSTKSMTGHLIGAAGAVEAIFCIQAIRNGVVPPTINLDTPDPECDLDYTPNRAAYRDMEYVLSNSFAFGGQNVSLLFKRV